VTDLYGVLGVSKGASQQEIKKAYRKLAAKYHPDKSPGAANEQRFKDLSNAYDTLGDEQKRKDYDEFGEVALRPGFDAEQARAARSFGGFGGGGEGGNVHFDLSDLFAGGGGGRGGGFGDALGDMFRRRGAAGPGAYPGGGRVPQRGRDVSTTVRIPFADAVRGTTVKLAPRGTGDAIIVRIPPGADTGNKVRVRGKGSDGVNGAPPGDLFLEIEVEPHPHFSRDDDDLLLELPITIVEAYRGTQVSVPTPSGSVKLTVPKGVQSGTRMRLRGKGVPHKSKPAGDLYVRFLVTYPPEADDDIAAAIESLSEHAVDPRDDLAF
jgi:curved DNA-binding protein